MHTVNGLPYKSCVNAGRFNFLKVAPLQPYAILRVSPLLILLLSVASSYAQVAGAQTQLAGDVISRFCKLDAAGKRLNPVGEEEMAKQLLLKENSWEQPSEITVIRDHLVRILRSGKGSTEFAVDYRILGQVDSSLGLTHLQTPYTNQPIIQSEHFSLALSDTHFELGNDGRLHQIKGVPEWRIKTAPLQPHVSIAAAMEYVRMASYRSKDPAVKMHAEKTLMDLQSLRQSQAMPAQVAAPEAVLSQFIEMQADGRGLTVAGSKQLDIFFLHPAQWLQGRVGVAKSYVVRDAPFSGNKANAYVEYAALGELDSQLRFTGLSANSNTVRQDYTLVLDNKYSASPRGIVPAREFAGPSRWRIENAPPEQWITLDAAIRYVTQLRQSATDPSIRRNAAEALATLTRLR